ncbi:MAG: hypothetical protein EHM14_04145 [Methanothrix sp.]|nr:MAG: hypothetical protein EHM14_04145 [Methanothrix sp.]
MVRRNSILVLAALLILAAHVLAVPSLSLSQENGVQKNGISQKIDTALAKQLSAGDGEKIPVIVILKSGADAKLDDSGISSNDFAVKYKYHLIPGLAGEATAKGIETIAKSDEVQGVYFDESAKVSAPDDNASNNASINNASINISINASIGQSKFASSYSSASDIGSDSSVSFAKYINADKLWAKGIDGKGITIAVLDSGIDKNHPDLVGRVIGETNFITDEVSADDLLGHGTMVSGIIAGSGAASGGKYKGIAPGANLLNVKVIDSKGDGKVSDIIAGIEWAIFNGADVLSLSLGGINLGETNPPITMAADNAADAGVVVCVAAGNRNSSQTSGQVATTSARQADDGNSPVDLSGLPQSEENNDVLLLLVPILMALPPGLIDSPGDGVNVITLGASDYQGHMAGFSGSGPTRDDRIKPDVVAPGVDIISTVPTGLNKLDYVDVYYAKESGTSLSTPVAAGLAALLLQQNKNLTPAGVKAAMIRGAQKLNDTNGQQYEEYYQGAGQIDAERSAQFQDSGVCAAIPDQWNAGRWAYLPSGKGVYVGLDTGADRPQKKIYALAPGDKDWSLRFVFISNQERMSLKTAVSGEISDWVSLQALPEHVAANDQVVFAASLTVPAGTPPGYYFGSIDISDGGENILEIPISVTVAEPFNITKGQGTVSGTLMGNQWDYYYLNVSSGANELDAGLNWETDGNGTNTDLDLFLLSPTSEYYSGKQSGSGEEISVANPPSGKWIMAVHSENSSEAVNYSLNGRMSLIKTTPQRWNIAPAYPGTSDHNQFVVENQGESLENLSYVGVINSVEMQDLEGSVGQKEVWEKAINVTNRTKKISAGLNSRDKRNESEILLVLENPEGEPADASLGAGDLGPIEIVRPENGTWKVKVYGYNVPEEGQSFGITLKEYSEDQWTWIKTRGPQRIESGSSGTVDVDITVPQNPSAAKVDGSVKISSDNHTLEIPVSVSVAGTTLQGLSSSAVLDADNDSLFDLLNLSFGVNVTVPGDFRLEAVLADCSGHEIELLSRSATLQKSGPIEMSVNGSRIWMNGICGPLQVNNLILYDKNGNYIDRFEKNITIDLDPKQFQPPAAYLTGEYVNRTTSSKIAVGVNVSVTKAGDYQMHGIFVDDSGEELGEDSVESKLVPGNATLVLGLNPTKFMMLGEPSRVYLVDLVFSLDGKELERVDEPWASETMDPASFKVGIGAASALSDNASNNNSSDKQAGTLKMENGKMVIS